MIDDNQNVPTARFLARAPGLGFWVDVSVVGHEHRYVAFAAIAGDVELGFGTSPDASIDDVLSREFGPLVWNIDERPRAHPRGL